MPTYGLEACPIVFIVKSELSSLDFVVNRFLPRDASAERGDATVSRPSVRLPVTFRYQQHIGWNSWKTRYMFKGTQSLSNASISNNYEYHNFLLCMRAKILK